MFIIGANGLLSSMTTQDWDMHAKTEELRRSSARGGFGAISSHVTNTLASNPIPNVAKSPQEVPALLLLLEDLAIVPVSFATTKGALELMGECLLSFYGALIVASAKDAGCRTLSTENVNSGQMVTGEHPVNLFLCRT